jgi:RimK family alpha-L-glutamate ligase
MAAIDRAVIIGSPEPDASGIMYEKVLRDRGVDVAWVTMRDFLRQTHHISGISMETYVERNPHAVDVNAQEFAFDAGSLFPTAYKWAILVSNEAENYNAVFTHMLETVGVLQFDAAENLAAAADKWLTHVAFKAAGLPVPHAEMAETRAEAREICRRFRYPIVVKEPKECRGTGVRWARSDAELEQTLTELRIEEQPLMLEHYIECGSMDKRIIVTNGKFTSSMARHAADGDFRANIALGGSMGPCVLSNEEIELAERGAGVLGLRLVGMDMSVVTSVLPGRDYLPRGSPFFIEANPIPGMVGPFQVTGIDGSILAIDMLLNS